MCLAYFLFFLSNSPILLFSIPFLKKICEVCVLHQSELPAGGLTRLSARGSRCPSRTGSHRWLMAGRDGFDGEDRGGAGWEVLAVCSFTLVRKYTIGEILMKIGVRGLGS